MVISNEKKMRVKRTYLLSSGEHYAILHYFKDKRVVELDRGHRRFLQAEEVLTWDELERRRDRDALYVLDSDRYSEKIVALKEKGYRTYGGELTNLERDRIACMEVFEKAGIDVPDWEYAETYDELIEKLERIRFEKVVVKGDTKVPKWGTLSGTRDKVMKVLEDNRELWENSKDWIIQEFVEGYEISCEVYFKDGVWEESLTNWTLETKTLLSGGVRTGGESNLIIPYGMINEKLGKVMEETLKLASVVNVRDALYDINFIVRGNRAYALEITPRIGYPGTITFAHLLMHNGFHYDEALKSDMRGEKIVGFGFGVKLTLPPYPFLDYQDLDKLFESIEKGKEEKEKKKELLEILKSIPYLKGVKIDVEEIDDMLGERSRVAWDGVWLSTEGRLGEISSDELGVLNTFDLDFSEAINTAYNKEIKMLQEYIPLLQFKDIDENLVERIKYFLLDD